jgi:hypothetical protein
LKVPWSWNGWLFGGIGLVNSVTEAAKGDHEKCEAAFGLRLVAQAPASVERHQAE